MKKLVMAALLVVGMTTFAQERMGERKEKLTPEQRVNLQVKKLTKDLSLNEKQVQEIKALVAKEAEKREAKRAEMDAKRASGAKPSKEEMKAHKAKVQEDQAAMDANMKKILSADQYAKWVQKREERKEKMEEKRDDRKKGKGAPQEVK